MNEESSAVIWHPWFACFTLFISAAIINVGSATARKSVISQISASLFMLIVVLFIRTFLFTVLVSRLIL